MLDCTLKPRARNKSLTCELLFLKVFDHSEKNKLQHLLFFFKGKAAHTLKMPARHDRINNRLIFFFLTRLSVESVALMPARQELCQ